MTWYQLTALISVVLIILSGLRLGGSNDRTGDDYIGEVLATLVIIGGLISLVVAGIGWVGSW